MPEGYQRAEGGLKRIVVSFDVETFDEINRTARNGGITFAERVRELCEWGMMSEAIGEPQ